MTVFLGDSAFYLGTLVFGFGVWLLFLASKETNKLLKVGGSIVTIIGLLGLFCTGYYWMKYYFDDVYENPYPPHMMQQMMGSGGMMKGMMGKGGMMPGMMMGMMKNMQNCMQNMEGKVMNEEMMGMMKSCMMKGMAMEGKNKMPPEEHESHH